MRRCTGKLGLPCLPVTLEPTAVDPRDPLQLRADAPLFDAWLRHEETIRVPMTTPGHKRRTDRFGSLIAGDVPKDRGLDFRQPYDLTADAEARIARAWDADWARISVGGSTHGNQSLALALGQPGDEVVVARSLHRSTFTGLVLAGLQPVWVQPEIDPASGLPMGLPVSRVAEMLRRHPRARAVILTEPSYVGTVSDLTGHAELAHAHGIPLIVDQAWGAYLGFHPDVGQHALQAGADALVTSAHKTLPAYNQAAFVIARTARLDATRLDRGFDATHTTSPSGVIMASADASRALLTRDGHRLIGDLIRLVSRARDRLEEVPGLRVMRSRSGMTVDPTKLVVLFAGTGANGLDVESDLARSGINVENADQDSMILLVTMADDERPVAAACGAVIDSVEARRGTPRPVTPQGVWTVAPDVVMSPREAFFAPHVTVPAAQAVGRVSAELVAPYPPGVPVLAPGERITAEAVTDLQAAADAGVQVRYATDSTLRTFDVVA